MREGLDKTRESQESTRENLTEVSAEIRQLRERLVELSLIARTSRLEVLQAKKQMDNIHSDIKSLEEELSGINRPALVREFQVVHDEYIHVQHVLSDYQDVNENVARAESELEYGIGEVVDHEQRRGRENDRRNGQPDGETNRTR